MKYMLDTNACIHLIKDRPEGVRRRFETLTRDQVGISSITLAELEYGVCKSAHPDRNRQALDHFLAHLKVAAFDAGAARESGDIRQVLAARGRPIGPYDLLIAGHARSLGAVLVTNNRREFDRVDGLAVEDWTT